MIRYVHGSEDSLDVDVFYVFDKLPHPQECKEFCSDKEENRNIIVVKDGVVTDCYKGTVDEINNGVFYTYPLHEQTFDLIITRPLERDVLMKAIRVVRCFLSHCSRTDYRTLVKDALRSPSWKKKLETIRQIDYASIPNYDKNGSKEDVLKVFAFQLGQVLGLFENKEFYTKSSVAKAYPELRKYLYREIDTDLSDLLVYLSRFLEKASEFHVEETENLCRFYDFRKTVDLKAEQYVEENA